jgi:hypothetical protein
MEHPIRRYAAVIVHRRPELEQGLKDLHLGPHDRLAAAEAAWRVAMQRGTRTDFLLVESNGRILYAAKVLGVEGVTARELAEMPKLKGRIRFITSHHVPDFVNDLIGTAVDKEFLSRNPVRYAEIVHDVAAKTVVLEHP